MLSYPGSAVSGPGRERRLQLGLGRYRNAHNVTKNRAVPPSGETHDSGSIVVDEKGSSYINGTAELFSSVRRRSMTSFVPRFVARPPTEHLGAMKTTMTASLLGALAFHLGRAAAECPHNNLLRCLIGSPSLAIPFCSSSVGIFPTPPTSRTTTTPTV